MACARDDLKIQVFLGIKMQAGHVDGLAKEVLLRVR